MMPFIDFYNGLLALGSVFLFGLILWILNGGELCEDEE